jgi:signal transduction histidine kinase/ActR/RegA family two-component response regulator
VKHSLRLRVLVALCGTAVLSATLGLAFQDRALRRDLEVAAVGRAERAAEAARLLVQSHLEALAARWSSLSTTPQLRATLEVGDGPTLAHLAEELRARQQASRILFSDARGRVVAAAGDAALDPLVLGQREAALVAHGGRLFAVASAPLETSGLALGRLHAVEPIDASTLARWSQLCGGELRLQAAATGAEPDAAALVLELGPAGLWLTASLAAEREALGRSRLNLLGAAAASLAAALALSVLFARGLVSPVQRLKDAAERIGRGDLGVRVPLEREDELGELSAALNEMAQHLQEQRRALEQTNAELVVEKERALAASRAKSHFLANVSHEVRTPLTAVLGWAELLQEGAALDAEQRESVAAIRRNGAHLLQLVDDVLDISRIEAGKLRVERRPCAPAAIVEEVIDILRTPARERGLELGVEYATPLPAVVSTDATRLRQILLNLVGNALKFTAQGGVRLVVRIEEAAGAAARLVFEVIDTGIGIPPDYLPRLFQSFSQADDSATRRFGGNGLGLAISRSLVEHLGGAIDVRSEPGRGSTFRFWIDPGPLEALPRATPLPARRAAYDSDAEPSCAGRVLLAEDSPDSQRLLGTILRRASYRVELAGDGQEAVARALGAAEAGLPFDVVLMDMQMPALDGYEATARLRAAGYSGAVVALTAHAMEGDREKCVHAGCDDFATKPIGKAALLELVARHVRKPPAPV